MTQRAPPASDVTRGGPFLRFLRSVPIGREKWDGPPQNIRLDPLNEEDVNHLQHRWLPQSDVVKETMFVKLEGVTETPP